MLSIITKIPWLHKGPVRLCPSGFRREDIDTDTFKVVCRLKSFGHAAYIVGGAVRDLALGIRPKDFDVATSAHPIDIKRIFGNAIIIGHRFKLVHIRFRYGKIIETATFRRHHGQKEGQVVTHDNVFGTEKEDAFRRDFTVNALFFDPDRDEIIDYVGGLADLKKRILRSIGDPDERLVEDPVRMIRAVKFSAKFGLAMDPRLEKAIRKHRDKISLCSQRRLFEELIKILKAGMFSAFVRRAAELSLLDRYLPFIAQLREKNSGYLARLLTACDECMKNRDTGLYIPFSLLTWPLVEDKYRQCRDIQKALRLTFHELQSQLPVSKNEKLDIRTLMLFIPRFDYLRHHAQKKKFIIRKMVRMPAFNEALYLYGLIERSRDQVHDGYEFWKRTATLVRNTEMARRQLKDPA
ncbi:MAG: hypothetical protein A2268_00725 [Candidatus Raymondbacteria bacterium RifOxyA12_full_50_37]|nr:MAG: hypothetical protein A2268_00725 [Candidatus Raymondbacteria bacterium RifOxyA12_full_50_37]OGJ90053.1 MAG: hypothetical protein A2248_19055 [Candidatus Raymondbacteria bacterium RIFOXYA2_FULL_49_16]OGJ96693.1 MAG: hypothetical protein A2350_01905 [Candidatus Raymondbacteria bacterium RifOxyB12_full_50_8]OGJ96737.1 MAG: hypothetical protein A2453_06180 [Candidatus Raymondbacteria bacterium RIFOXYC2_FULL_50_21]OGP42273.1 MAG: hypothetical protein A2324_01190 [Candidatus Raymondbacteria b